VVRQHDEIRKFNYEGDIQYLIGKVDGKREEDGMMLVDVAIEVRNQRGDTTAQADATISLPSRELGAAMLPDVPKDLQRDAVRMFERHGELLKTQR